jgi:hypothetical protein
MDVDVGKMAALDEITRINTDTASVISVLGILEKGSRASLLPSPRLCSSESPERSNAQELWRRWSADVH